MNEIQSITVQTPDGFYFKVGLICPTKDVPVTYIEHRSVESKDGNVYSAYDVYGYEDELLATVENCPVVVIFENSI